MKRLRLSLVAILATILAPLGAYAVTDVTSTYIANPSFELSAAGTALTSTISVSNTASAGIYGWTATLANTSYINIDVVNSTTTNHSQFGTTVTPNDGTYYFSYRHGWNKGVVDKFTTTSLTDLPVGEYTLSVMYKGASSYDNTTGNSTLAISAVESGTTLATSTSSAFQQYSGGTSNTYFQTAAWTKLSVSFTVTTAGSVDFVFTSNVNGQRRTDLLLDNVTLSSGLDLTEYNALKATAQSNLDAYTIIQGSVRKTLTDLLAAEDPTTSSALSTAISNITAANTAFLAAKYSYENLSSAITQATALGVSSTITDAANTVLTSTTATVDDVNPSFQTVNVAEYDAATTKYLGDETSEYVTPASWTSSSINSANKGQHWDGTTTTTYFENNTWSSSSWTSTNTKTLSSLPIGKYVLKVAGRAASGVTLTMSLTPADGTATTVQFPSNGDTGYGLNPSGAADFTSGDTYANTTGRGWEWRFIPFEVTASKDYTLAFTATSSTIHTWFSVDDIDMKLLKIIAILDESETSAPTAQTNIDVKLNRTLNANVWNTLCLPFSMTAAQISSAFGSDAKIVELSSDNNSSSVVNFTSATAITAHKPCLIMPSAAITSSTIKNATITTGTPSDTQGNVTFTGSYIAGTAVPADDYFISDNYFYKATASSLTMNAFRGYFTISGGSAKGMNLSIDGTPTSIKNIDGDETAPMNIYNLNGQRVRTNATSTNGLAKGIYVVNGKKVTVK